MPLFVSSAYPCIGSLICHNTLFADNLVGLFFVVCFLYKTDPNPRDRKCCGKKWPKGHF